MPETPEQIYERSVNALRVPSFEKWGTWPFDGALQVRTLLPPDAAERPRRGEGGVDCWTCGSSDDAYLWTNERWRVRPLAEPSGLPVVVFLETRAHYAEPGDLPDDLAAEGGIMLGRVERAVRSIGDIGRVHICRWGDGSEHLHWWFMARPARLPQLLGTFAAIWDEVLPPTPEDVWKANMAQVAHSLSAETRQP